MNPEKNNPSHQPSARYTEEGERFNRTLFAAVDALDQDGIDYALIGGVAASGMGRPRSTHDIDIFVRPEDAEGTLEALARHDFKTEKTDYNWLFKGWKENILVDIIFKSSGDLYFDDEMKNHAREINYHGKKIKAVSPEDLVIIKCAVHNEVGPHHWHDALAILSHAGVDWNYLFKRARRAPRRVLALLIYAQSNDILVPNYIIHSLFELIFGEKENHMLSAVSAAMIQKTSHSTANSQSKSTIVHSNEKNQPHTLKHCDSHLITKIKDALSKNKNIGNNDVKILIEENHLLLRGESNTENQKAAIEEVILKVAPGFKVDNQITVPILPGPEGAEVIT